MATRIQTPSNFSTAIGGLRFLQGQAQLALASQTTGIEDLLVCTAPAVAEDFSVLLKDAGAASSTTPMTVALTKKPVGSATTQTLVTISAATENALLRGYPSSATSQAALVLEAGDTVAVRLTGGASSTALGWGMVRLYADVTE